MSDVILGVLLGLLLGLVVGMKLVTQPIQQPKYGLYEKCSMMYEAFPDRMACVDILESADGRILTQELK